MALIKFGSVVTNGSGKLGGHVFQNSKGGMQLRTKPIPTGKPSLSQISIRSINKTLQKGWHDLTDAQRKVWNDWAVSHSIMTVRDPHKPISGHDLWMKYNFNQLIIGSSIWHYPWGPDPGSYGPELIKNGAFNSGSDWTVEAGWNISGGKANFLDTITSAINQNLVLPAATTYKLEFDISNCVWLMRLKFCRTGSTNLFIAPYNAELRLTNGHFNYIVTTSANSVLFRILAYTVDGAFAIDNISLKQRF